MRKISMRYKTFQMPSWRYVFRPPIILPLLSPNRQYNNTIHEILSYRHQFAPRLNRLQFPLLSYNLIRRTFHCHCQFTYESRPNQRIRPRSTSSICTSGSVLQTALCYLKAIHAKVPELVEREKTGDGVQGEPDLSGKIVQGYVDAVEWQALLLDSVNADFIHTDAAIDANAAETDAMATVKVVDSDEEPQYLSLPSLPRSFARRI
jgi:hypothetical protein